MYVTSQWRILLRAPLLISGSHVGPQFEKDSVKLSRIQGLLSDYMAKCMASP